MPKSLDGNISGLVRFEIGDKLKFTNDFPRKDEYQMLLPLRFVRYNTNEKELCLCLDNQGDFFSTYRCFLQLVKES